VNGLDSSGFDEGRTTRRAAASVGDDPRSMILAADVNRAFIALASKEENRLKSVHLFSCSALAALRSVLGVLSVMLGSLYSS
jgi:hypothetical protein